MLAQVGTTVDLIKRWMGGNHIYYLPQILSQSSEYVNVIVIQYLIVKFTEILDPEFLVMWYSMRLNVYHMEKQVTL